MAALEVKDLLSSLGVIGRKKNWMEIGADRLLF